PGQLADRRSAPRSDLNSYPASSDDMGTPVRAATASTAWDWKVCCLNSSFISSGKKGLKA
ncbi:MAG: hypothetical protein WCQ21_30000, partial [Verrucomicrobiota bacterium]